MRSLVIYKATTAGERSIEQASKFFAVHGGLIKRIHESYLWEDEDLRGVITLGITVRDDKEITATLISDTKGNAELAEAINGAINNWAVRGNNGVVQMTFTLDLHPLE